jgi:hemoglobin
MEDDMRKSIVVVSAVTLLGLLPGVGSAQDKPAAPSLYDRLGGLHPVSAVVDAFIDRVYANATLNANPAIGNARSAVRKPGLKVHVATLVCQVTGGPCKYVGKGMKESHSTLHISPKEWDAALVDFRASLDRFKVPAAEQGELIAHRREHQARHRRGERREGQVSLWQCPGPRSRVRAPANAA